jgi:uncharacterized protein YfaS (alpha-2-macroglobulin family)
MIGIKPEFDGDGAAGRHATFKRDRRRRQRQPQGANGLVWSLVKHRARLPVVPQRQFVELRAGDLHPQPSPTARSTSPPTRMRDEAPVDWGRYRLEVETRRPGWPGTSYEFDAGWYVEATSTETPDGLEIALDKDAYAAGDVAKLQVSPRFAGELLVTVGAERLLTTVTATCRKAARRSTFRSAPTGAPAPMSPPPSSVRATSRNRACRRAPSA